MSVGFPGVVAKSAAALVVPICDFGVVLLAPYPFSRNACEGGGIEVDIMKSGEA